MSAEQRSAWIASAPSVAREPLRSDVTADVCIVGAGIAGLSAAYFLAEEERLSVVVLERGGRVAHGETGHTTAHFTAAIDDRYTELERIIGRAGARIAAESHMAAIDRVESLVAEHAIDCGFERLDGFLVLAPGSPIELLEDECAAASRAGLADVELVPVGPLRGSFAGPYLRFPRQAQLHPLEYVAGLARVLESRGVRIFTDTAACEVKGGASPQVVCEAGVRVSAGAVVIATNTPFEDRLLIHAKQAPYTTYAIAMRVPRGSVPRVLCWDTADPYHYVRLASASRQGAADDPLHELLVVGGEDHKTGQAWDQADRHRRLEDWARRRFPSVEDVAFRWSGQVMETVDGLAYIGREPEGGPNVYVATGDSGHGMTHGTVAGMLLRDLVLRRANPWERAYDPSRLPLRGLGEVAREGLNVALQYGRWLRGGDVASAAEIRPGKGAVVRSGIDLLAVYRDEGGGLHARRAACTHLGCAVAWNDLEKTWDCPCHGSRFDPQGRVMHGPASRDLAAADPAAVQGDAPPAGRAADGGARDRAGNGGIPAPAARAVGMLDAAGRTLASAAASLVRAVARPRRPPDAERDERPRPGPGVD